MSLHAFAPPRGKACLKHDSSLTVHSNVPLGWPRCKRTDDQINFMEKLEENFIYLISQEESAVCLSVCGTAEEQTIVNGEEA